MGDIMHRIEKGKQDMLGNHINTELRMRNEKSDVDRINVNMQNLERKNTHPYK